MKTLKIARFFAYFIAYSTFAQLYPISQNDYLQRYSIAYAGNNISYGVGNELSNIIFSKSTDGGINWNVVSSIPGSYDQKRVKNIKFLSDNLGYVSFTDGSLFKLSNGGSSVVDLGVTYDNYTISTNNVIYAGSDTFGYYYLSTNDGNNFNIISALKPGRGTFILNQTNPNAIFLYSTSGINDYLCKSFDNGISWTSTQLPKKYNFTNFTCYNDNIIFAINSNSNTIYTTTNSGLAWDSLISIPNLEISFNSTFHAINDHELVYSNNMWLFQGTYLYNKNTKSNYKVWGRYASLLGTNFIGNRSIQTLSEGGVSIYEGVLSTDTLLTVSPSYISVSSSGGNMFLDVKTSGFWNVNFGQYIVTIPGSYLFSSTGFNNGRFGLYFPPNTSTLDLYGSIDVSIPGLNQKINYIQSGAPAPYLQLSTSNSSITSNLTILTLSITSNIDWQIPYYVIVYQPSMNYFIPDFSTLSGFGNKIINITIPSNNLNVTRMFGLSVSGVANTLSSEQYIYQSGNASVSTNLAVSTNILNYSASGGNMYVNVSTTGVWVVNIISNSGVGGFITNGAGSGNGTFAFTLPPNTTSSPINGMLAVSIAGETHYISFSQVANFSFSMPGQITVPWGSSVSYVQINSNTTWTISGSCTIHNFSPSTGYGNKLVTITTNSMYMGNSYCVPTVQYGTGSYYYFGILYQNELAFISGDLTVSSSTGQSFHGISSNTSWNISILGNNFSVSPNSGYGNAVLTVTALTNNSTAIDKVVTLLGFSSVSGQLMTSKTITQSAGIIPTFPGLSLSTNTLSFSANGGNRYVNVSTSGAWVASIISSIGNGEYITNGNGTGNGTFALTLLPNALTNSLSGILMVSIPGAMQYVIYYQNGTVSGIVDLLQISPYNTTISPNLQVFTLSVTSNLQWQILNFARDKNNNQFDIAPSYIYGSNNQNVNITVPSNVSGSVRIFVVTIVGSLYPYPTNVLEITQEGSTIATTTSPILEVSPQNITSSATGISQSISITTTGNWLTYVVSSGGANFGFSSQFGTGKSNFNFYLYPNYSTNQINGIIAISTSGITKYISFTQAPSVVGITSYLQLSSGKNTISGLGEIITISISSNLNWFNSFGNNSSLSYSSLNGFGDALITVTVSPNTNAFGVYHTISITGNNIGRMIQFYQPSSIIPLMPTLTVSSNSLNYSSAGGTLPLNILSNTNWSITGIPSWISLSTNSGFGNASLTISSFANSSLSGRSGSFKIYYASTFVSVNVSQGGITVSPPTTSGVVVYFTNTPTLYWTTVPGATNYCIQIALDSTFSNPLLSICNIKGLQYTVPPGILTIIGVNPNQRDEPGKYYWKVAPVYDGIVGTYSKPIPFIVAGVTEVNKETLKTNTEFSIYPVPNDGKFTIIGLESGVPFEIFSIIGESVYSGKLSENKIIDIQLSGGIYIFKSGKIFKKFTVR
ncbi:MAG: hypothetical protein SFY32_11135 [Bacteroidota bacterium]|nr:hypothetical protein [Bacteroidota bacterium]